MTDELCGKMTPHGPCSMKKDHATKYHRHRVFEVMEWELKVGTKKIESGINRVPLNYAIKDALNKHDKFTIVVKKRKSTS
jgi:hypothetical protein